MRNREVAAILVKIADMMQIKGDNPYKIRAYRKAAESIFHLDEDIAILYGKGRVREVPGIGDAVAAKIGEILKTGSCEYYDRLSEEIPAGLWICWLYLAWGISELVNLRYPGHYYFG